MKRSFVLALLVLLIALASISVATFAWYIFSINAHTTNVHMAAGAGASLQISDKADGVFGSSAVLEEFVGSLDPVSTNRIQSGFQKVAITGFANGNVGQGQPSRVAKFFTPGTGYEYYKTSLFLRTNGSDTNVYISNIGYEDSDAEAPISTAIRVGFVVPSTGEEFIFAINLNENPEKLYNTATGRNGFVLDSSKTDGTTVEFIPYTSDNFCIFDSETNTASLGNDSLPICTVSGASGRGYGEPVEIEVYIWLEGCDEDCADNLGETTLSNLAISFAGIN